MQNMQYPDHQHESFTNAFQAHNNTQPNNPQLHYFNDAGYLQNASPYSSSLSDPTSLPPTGLLNDLSQRNSMRPYPPALQTHNLTGGSGYAPESPYSSYHQSFESPGAQLQSLTMTTPPSFYMNGSAADSLTTFSPSSNTSGELGSPEATSLTLVDSLMDDMDTSKTPTAGTRIHVDRPDRKKRNSRRMWTHSLEKYIFTPHEIATLGTPHRRTIYSASLEAHIDRLHSQLLGIDLYPVPVEDLNVYRGLNCKIAKGMVAGLQHDFVQVRTRLLEIERATTNAREMAVLRANHDRIAAQDPELGDTYGIERVHKQSLESHMAPDFGQPSSTSSRI